jgi:hypothetical protein
MRICVKHIAVMALTSFALAACGGGEESSGSGATNLPPIISGNPTTTLTAGSPYTFTPTAADPDGDALTFRASGLPTWVTFNTSTGTVSGTPTEAHVGATQSITIEVTDSKAWTQLAPFQINVASQGTTQPPPATNVAPTISGTPATNAFPGQAYSFTPVGADANGDELTFSATGLPVWLTFTPATGAVTGTPPAGTTGNIGPIQIIVSDGSLTASLQFTLSMQPAPPANRAPTITGTPSTSITVGSANGYRFAPVASDPDGNRLTFTIQGRPSWLNFNATTGVLSGTPQAANVGTSSRMTITVSDGTLSASLPSFTIQVNAAANRAPTISGSPLLSINVLTAYSFQPSASDPDGNPLTFTVQNLPAWATFSSASGRISGTPTIADIATFNNIIVTVSDGTATASLPGFNLSVIQAATGSATVNWTPPTTNTDGSALTNLSGYRVLYGRAQDSLDQSEEVNNAGASNVTISNLAVGTWYFAVVALNASGAESDLSNVATKVVAN